MSKSTPISNLPNLKKQSGQLLNSVKMKLLRNSQRNWRQDGAPQPPQQQGPTQNRFR